MYNHKNNDDYMVILTCFIDIDDAVHDTRDQHSQGDKNGTSSVYDDPGKSFLILISYKVAHNTQDIKTVKVKRIVGHVYMMILVNHFLY